MATNPIGTLRAYQKQYGHTFTINHFGTRTVITADTDLISDIYAVKDLDLFGPLIPATFDVLLGADSFGMHSGERHRIDRRLISPSFHGDRMRVWGSAIAEATRQAFGEGELEVNVEDVVRKVTLEVIIRVILGVDDDARVYEFSNAITEWCDAIRPGFLFLRALQHDYWGLSSYARYNAAAKRVHGLFLDQIAQIRASGVDRGDVLSGMIAARSEDGSMMSNATICDHLSALLFAGHETSTSTIAWSLYFLNKSPQAKAKLQQEIDANFPAPSVKDIKALGDLPYLSAVFEETLRMRPVTTDTFRLLLRPWRLGKWCLPKGVALCPASVLVHYRPDLWPEPEVFRPERFLKERPARNAYLPFGGGMRRCLGASFAHFEVCIVLGVLLHFYETELLNQDVRWQRKGLTLQPVGGVKMRIRRKSTAARE